MTVYILTETHEEDGIRDFEILGVWSDKEIAKDILNKYIEEDPYEDFKNKGIENCGELFCESCYEDGFTAYHIIEKEVEE